MCIRDRVKLEHEEQWASYSWFIPILNLFRPYGIMKEIWTNTQLHSNTERVESTELVSWWWAAWIINTVVGNISLKLPADTIEELKTSTLVDIFGDIINVLGLILAILVVKKVSNFERTFYNSIHEMSIEDHLVDDDIL